MTVKINADRQSIRGDGYCDNLESEATPAPKEKSLLATIGSSMTQAVAKEFSALVGYGVMGRQKIRKKIPDFKSPTKELIELIKKYDEVFSDKNIKTKGRVHFKDSAEANEQAKLQEKYLSRVNYLISLGADINTVIDEDNNTLLHFAVWTNNSNLISFLVKLGADLNKKNTTSIGKLTPYEYAQATERELVARALKNENYRSISKAEAKKLSKSSRSSATKEGKYLISSTMRKNGINDLHMAIMQNDPEEALRLIKSHSEYVSAATTQGFTALHFATQYGRSEIVLMLIHHGASLNVQDKEGRTPLHYAAIYGKVEMPGLLNQKNANPNIQDKEGETALHYAVLTEKPEMATSLINIGSSADIKNNDGETPLSLITASQNIKVQALIQTLNPNSLLHLAKNAALSLTSAAIGMTAFSTYSLSCLKGVASWITLAATTNTLLRFMFPTASHNRVASEFFAGVIVLSTTYFLGNFSLAADIAKTMLLTYAIEHVIKKIIPATLELSDILWKRFFQKEVIQVFQNVQNDELFS